MLTDAILRILLLTIIMLPSCAWLPWAQDDNGQKKEEVQKVNTTESRYAFELKKKDTVFVFIHGIFGDAFGTWYNKATKKHFFELMKETSESKMPTSLSTASLPVSGETIFGISIQPLQT